MSRFVPVLMLLSGCELIAQLTEELPAPRNCEERSSWYPDEDGDGLGEPTEVYVGCQAPTGWVDNADDTPADSGQVGDSGQGGDSGSASR